MTVVDNVTGHLLLAGPALWDPNFRRTVILIGQHDEEGAVGVVLNRATELTVAQAAPPLAPIVADGDPLFIGGPVEPSSAVVLADLADPQNAEILALGSIGFLPPEVPADTAGGIRRARVFAGYAGWGPGQLEREMAEEGSWIAEPATPDDIFTSDPEGLWSAVLKRKGPAFDLLRFMPLDPSTN
ncbi:MAG: YqgE/AlgH family protein [Actinobacteria bacterium]|nr:YqgE/AlgH family protein [Actinomycetota bacterium]